MRKAIFTALIYLLLFPLSGLGMVVDAGRATADTMSALGSETHSTESCTQHMEQDFCPDCSVCALCITMAIAITLDSQTVRYRSPLHTQHSAARYEFRPGLELPPPRST